MECTTARERLLTAEPDELMLDRDHLLSAHLRTCADCRARAERIMSSTRALARALEPGATMRPVAIPAARQRHRRPALAAAAALALLATGHGVLLDSVVTTEPSPSGATVDVTVPVGQNAMVFRTSDPTITVVWFY